MGSNQQVDQLKKQLAWLRQTGQQFAMQDVLEELIRLQPEEFDWQVQKGSTLLEIGRAIEAIQVFESCREACLKKGEDSSELVLNLGHAHSALGRFEAAAAFYNQLVHGVDDAMVSVGYWSLADLKGYQFSDIEIEKMRERSELLDAGSWHRYFTLFALGNGLDRSGEYEAAFKALKSANDQVAANRPYAENGYTQLARSLLGVRGIASTDERVDGPLPVFIVGMPRSGSTLLEQMLASHSKVEATAELPFIEELARQLDRQGGYAQMLPRLSAAQCIEGARNYLQKVEPFLLRDPDAFIDKWPNNFWYIGLIKAFFPHARILNIMRDPLDNAMGVYKQYFGYGNEHSYKLTGIISYWKNYLRVMSHWEKAYPGQILHVKYDELVRDVEVQLKRVTAYCGLSFEEPMLRFYESERPVMTASGGQVRQGVYDTSIGSGTKYTAQLRYFLPEVEELRQQMNKLAGEG